MENSTKSINMIDAVKLFFKNYFNFTGRASRSEYWWFILAFAIVYIVISTIETVFIFATLLDDIYDDPYSYSSSDILKDSFLMPSSLFYLAMMIGLLSLAARRLQDRGHSGWWQLANIIPGILFLIPYFAILDSIITGGSFVPGQAIAATIFGIISFGTGVTMIVFLCLPPKEDENKWGRNPLLSDNRLTDQIPD
tara:strand:- start:449 stop:1033 length:585 start_codon:yes stop_codon:yes gene_type:complete